MTDVYENFALPAEINILKFRKEKTGDLVGVCTKIEKEAKSAPTTHRGLQHSATTCCPWYPSGSTVLECRLEGDQPVAHVQVPADGGSATQKMCLLVEAKQSPHGPLSRVTSRPQDDSRGPNELNQTSDKSSPPMTYCLESFENPEGATAVAAKVPTTNSNIVITLETTNDAKECDGPSSRILYGPAIEKIAGGSDGEENSRNAPVTFIDCTATRKGTIARIAECSSNDADPRKICYETCVPKDDGCPTAVGFECQSENSIPCQQDVLETRVDEYGPRTCLITRNCGRYCSYMESKSSCDGPSARITQQPSRSIPQDECLDKKIEEKVHYSPINCTAIYSDAEDDQKRPPASSKDKVSLTERRNGLDTTDNTRTNPFKLGLRRRVCPPRCPLLEKLRPGCGLFGQDQLSQNECANSEPMSRSIVLEDAAPRKSTEDRREMKEHVVGDCKMEALRAADRKDAKVAFNESSKCPTNGASRIGSEELLTRYRDYVPPNLLNRYEACRSKRNGLQDQCFLPVPRAVIELKKIEAECRDENREKSCKDVDNRSMCTDRTLMTPRSSITSTTSKNFKELSNMYCV